MNQFRLFLFCVAALVASAMSTDVICNGGRGLQSYGNDHIKCYTAGQNPQEWNCPWAQCTKASGQNCQVNSHQWSNKGASFTCDRDYVLNPGVGEQIGCTVNADYAQKCPGGNGADCLASQGETHQATCQKINVHSHCRGCVPF